MKLYTEINPKIGLQLIEMAKILGLSREGNLFISPTGKKFIGCNMGFIEAEQYRTKVNIERLTDDIIELTEQNRQLRVKVDRLTKSMDKGKNIAKVCSILESKVSSEEKIKELTRYLNL